MVGQSYDSAAQQHRGLRLQGHAPGRAQRRAGRPGHHAAPRGRAAVREGSHRRADGQREAGSRPERRRPDLRPRPDRARRSSGWWSRASTRRRADQPANTVLSSSPAAGTKVDKGTTVTAHGCGRAAGRRARRSRPGPGPGADDRSRTRASRSRSLPVPNNDVPAGKVVNTDPAAGHEGAEGHDDRGVGVARARRRRPIPSVVGQAVPRPRRARSRARASTSSSTAARPSRR